MAKRQRSHTPAKALPPRSRVQRRWNALAQAPGQILWTTNPHGQVIDAHGWSAFTGKTRAALDRRGWMATIHPDDCAAVVACWQQAIAASAQFVVEGRIRRHDGEFRILLIRGMPVFDRAGVVQEWVGICTDVTELRRAEAERDAALQREKALRESQLFAMLESAVDGIVVYQADGTILLENRALRGALGLDQSETDAGKSFIPRATKLQIHDAQGNPYPPEQMPPMRVLRGERITLEQAVDLHLRSLQNQEIILSITGGPIRDEAGDITGGIINYRDVTAQRQAEREREYMVHVVSHELNTPIASMTMRAQLLRRHLQRGEAPTDADFAAVERDLKRLTRLVSDISEAGRISAPQFRLERHRCDLVALCRLVVEEQRALTGRAIDLVCLPGCYQVWADSERIEQVLENLLGNALKYTPPTAPVRLLLSSEQHRVRLSIRDEGPGITPANQQRLFERFFRVPGAEVYGGSGLGLGLGLFICQRLVQQHGGTIGVQSAPGAGATFWFTLPQGRAGGID